MDNNTNKCQWQLSISHLDTWAYQVEGHFFQAICPQYPNPSSGWLDKWTNALNDNTNQHLCQLRVSHLDTSACQILCYSFQAICQWMHRSQWMDTQPARWTISQRVFLCPPQLGTGNNVARNEYKKMFKKKQQHFLTQWLWPFTYGLEKLISSAHYQWGVYKIWDQSIQLFLSSKAKSVDVKSILLQKTSNTVQTNR